MSPWARSHAGPPAATAIAAGVVAGCLPAAATAEGRQIAGLYVIFVAIAVVVFILVYGLTTFTILRYRSRRGGRLSEPRQVHGNTRIEAIWTAIPLVIVSGLFVGTVAVLMRTEAQASAPAAEVHVRAFRWGWTFTYPAEGVEVSGIGMPGPEMVVPVGRPIRFVVTADDVVHSFFVPRFLFKRDLVPGRTNTFDITVDEAGTYRGQCAEFCGIGHAAMPFTVRAVDAAEYAAWLASHGVGESAPPFATPGASFLPVGATR